VFKLGKDTHCLVEIKKKHFEILKLLKLPHLPLNWCNGKTVSPSTTFDSFVANKEFVVTIAIITLKYAHHL